MPTVRSKRLLYSVTKMHIQTVFLIKNAVKNTLRLPLTECVVLIINWSNNNIQRTQDCDIGMNRY